MPTSPSRKTITAPPKKKIANTIPTIAADIAIDRMPERMALSAASTS